MKHNKIIPLKFHFFHGFHKVFRDFIEVLDENEIEVLISDVEFSFSTFYLLVWNHTGFTRPFMKKQERDY